jgi:hypothetical protein
MAVSDERNRDDAAEGHRLVERARAIFKQIGANGWLAEADAAR